MAHHCCDCQSRAACKAAILEVTLYAFNGVPAAGGVCDGCRLPHRRPEAVRCGGVGTLLEGLLGPLDLQVPTLPIAVGGAAGGVLGAAGK
jgi:hypothetical protein